MTAAVFDPLANYYELSGKADRERTAHLSTSLIRLWDGNMQTNIECRSDIETTLEDASYQPGGGTQTYPLSTPEGQFLSYYLDAEEDAHLTVEQTGYDDRITWKSRTITPTLAEDGTEVVEVEWICITVFWEHIMLRANPALPVSAQWPHIFAVPGNTKTVTKLAGHLGLMWQYAPLLSGVSDNVFTKEYWGNIDPRKWPVIMAPHDAGRDQSKGMITAYRFDLAFDAMRQSWEDAKCIPTAKMWLVGDRQPFPEYATLTQNTVILDVELHDNIHGITGTAADGWLKLGVGVLDDLITEVVHPILAPDQDWSDTPIADAIGMGEARPWPVYRHGEYSGIVEAQSAIHKQLWYRTYTGGRSPEWVNQGITLAITTALSYLGFALAIPGLDNLYQGQFDNTLLAFAVHTDRRRARKAGRFALVDGWEGGAGVGFGLSTGLALRGGWYKSRPHRTNVVEVVDCAPYPIGRVIKKGITCCFEMPDGSIYADMVTAIRLHRSHEEELRYSLVIGDDKDDEDPIAALWRHVSDFRSTMQRLFLGGN